MGRRIADYTIRSTITAALSLCVVSVLLAGFYGVALAEDLPTPNVTETKSLGVYRHLIENGDFLVVVHYDIHYDNSTDQPNLTTRKTFLLRMLDGNTSLGYSVPYPYFNDGYDEGCASLYWPNATAPLWNGNYTVRLEGNPTYWATPPMDPWTLTTSDYCTAVSQDDIRDELKEYILDIADSLEIDWDAQGALYTYAETGIVLSDVGSVYFSGAIRGLRTMCPELFDIQVIQPTVEETTYNRTQAHELRDRYNGTPIGDFTDALGDLLGGIGGQMVTGFICVAGMLGIVVLTAMKHGRASPGFLIGFPIMLVGTEAGFFSMTVLGVLSLLSVLLLAYFWFFRHGSG